MKTFISFSGEKSKATADALEDFLLHVAPDVAVVRSTADIALAQHWAIAVKTHLADINLALICVTRDNVEKPWFLFEIGTLAHRAPVIVLFLLDVSPEDLKEPLSSFQSVVPTRESTWELVKGVAGLRDASPDYHSSHTKFAALWEDFASTLQRIRDSPGSPPGVVTIFSDTQAIEVNTDSQRGSQVAVQTLDAGIGPFDRVFLNAEVRHVHAKLTISSEHAFQRINAAVRQNLEQLQENFTQARADSRQFFRLTIIFSSLGFIVMLTGVILVLLGQSTAGIVASITGIIPEATAALFFKKDAELRQTIETYHQHILQSQRMLTMIDVCETITDIQERDRMKQQIIFRGLDIAYPDEAAPSTPGK